MAVTNRKKKHAAANPTTPKRPDKPTEIIEVDANPSNTVNISGGSGRSTRNSIKAGITTGGNKTPVGSDYGDSDVEIETPLPPTKSKPSAADDTWWKDLVGPEQTRALVDTEDPINFATLARHLWGRAFLFKRTWSVEEKKAVYDQCLQEMSMKDRSRFKGILESAFIDAEEALSSTVREFATWWLKDTNMGKDYCVDYEAARVKKNARKYPLPPSPSTSVALLTTAGVGPEGFVWNVAIATRFWQYFLTSLAATAHPKRVGKLSWPELEPSSTSKENTWFAALTGVALELIRLAVGLLVQGEDRMSSDMHRTHFAAVFLPESFRKAVTLREDLQYLVKSRSSKDLIALPPNTVVEIDLQGCTSSFPHIKVQTPAPQQQTSAHHPGRLLDAHEADIGIMLESVESEISTTGSGTARTQRKKWDDNTHAAALNVENMLPSAIGANAHHWILEPETANLTFAAQQLGTSYAQANMFGRCQIHQMVMDLEIERMDQVIEAALERKEWLLSEIEAFEKQETAKEKRFNAAQQLFQENDELAEKAVTQRHQVTICRRIGHEAMKQKLGRAVDPSCRSVYRSEHDTDVQKGPSSVASGASNTTEYYTPTTEAVRSTSAPFGIVPSAPAPIGPSPLSVSFGLRPAATSTSSTSAAPAPWGSGSLFAGRDSTAPILFDFRSVSATSDLDTFGSSASRRRLDHWGQTQLACPAKRSLDDAADADLPVSKHPRLADRSASYEFERFADLPRAGLSKKEVCSISSPLLSAPPSSFGSSTSSFGLEHTAAASTAADVLKKDTRTSSEIVEDENDGGVTTLSDDDVTRIDVDKVNK